MMACNNVPAGSVGDSSSSGKLESKTNSSQEDNMEESSTQEGSIGEHEEDIREESTEENREGAYREDLFEFKVNIGKIAYRIPMAYSAMTSRGWLYEGDETVTLKPNQYTSEEFMERDDVILYVSFLNTGINTQGIGNSFIGQIIFDKLNLIGCETEIRFPGNIIYGQSTKEDVIAAYGEPTDIEELEGKEILTYKKGEYEWISFTIDLTANIISDVDMRNFVTPDNFDGGEITEEIPQEVLDYEAPDNIGTDLSKPYVNILGDLYEIPAPVSAFLDKGWSIVDDNSHQAVVAKGKGMVTLEKNGIRITSDVINYADNAVYIENCFVTTVYVDLEENQKGMMSIPQGICVNMPLAELESLLETVTYTTTMDKLYNRYTFYPL